MVKRKVMGKLAARKWLFSYAADLLRNAEGSDPICDRSVEHPDDPDAAEREELVIQQELSWVVDQIAKRGSWLR